MMEMCRSWDSIILWKDLGQKEFMAEYGEKVLAKYSIPTEGERKKYLDGVLDEEEALEE
jgi:hypothetical protein